MLVLPRRGFWVAPLPSPEGSGRGEQPPEHRPTQHQEMALLSSGLAEPSSCAGIASNPSEGQGSGGAASSRWPGYTNENSTSQIPVLPPGLNAANG